MKPQKVSYFIICGLLSLYHWCGVALSWQQSSLAPTIISAVFKWHAKGCHSNSPLTDHLYHSSRTSDHLIWLCWRQRPVWAFQHLHLRRQKMCLPRVVLFVHPNNMGIDMNLTYRVLEKWRRNRVEWVGGGKRSILGKLPERGLVHFLWRSN